MNAVVKSRKILQDGRVIFDVDVIETPASADGKTPAKTKVAALMLTSEMIKTIKEFGDPLPAVNKTIEVNWSVDALGTVNEKWVTM